MDPDGVAKISAPMTRKKEEPDMFAELLKVAPQLVAAGELKVADILQIKLLQQLQVSETKTKKKAAAEESSSDDLDPDRSHRKGLRQINDLDGIRRDIVQRPKRIYKGF